MRWQRRMAMQARLVAVLLVAAHVAMVFRMLNPAVPGADAAAMSHAEHGMM